MAQITWRDVAAPINHSATQGFSEFSKLFGDGISSLKGAVGGFDQSKSDLVNKQLLLALAQTPDAAAAQEGIAAGRLGGLDLTNPDFLRRVSAENLSALGPEAMTRLGTSQVALGQDRENAAQRAVRDGQSALFAKADALDRAGDNAGAEKLRASANYDGFGFSAVDALNKAAQTTEQNQISNDKSAFEFGNDKTAYADGTAVASVMSEIRSKAMNAEDVRFLLNDPKGPVAGLSPRARAMAERQAASEFPGLFGSDTGASAAIAGAAGGGAAPTFAGAASSNGSTAYDVVFGNGQYAKPPKAISSMTMGEVYDWGQNTLRPETKKAGFGKIDGKVVGTSAVGAYQIVGGTMERYAEKIYGPGWKSVQFSPEVQENIAKQIFADSKGGNLKAVWEGLPNSSPGAYANMSWDQVKGEILKHEIGASPSQLILEGNATNREMATRTMQEDPLGYGVNWAALKADSATTVNGVADRLIGTGDKPGPLYGTDRAYLLKTVRRVMSEAGQNGVAGINPAIAGAIIETNITGSDAGIWNTGDRLKRIATGGSPNLGGGARLDDRGITEVLGRIRSYGGLDNLATSSEARAMTGATIQTAQAKVAKAQSDLIAARTRAVSMPGLDTKPYEARLASAMMQLQLANSASAQPSNQTVKAPLPPKRQVRPPTGESRVARLLEKYTDGKKSD